LLFSSRFSSFFSFIFRPLTRCAQHMAKWAINPLLHPPPALPGPGVNNPKQGGASAEHPRDPAPLTADPA
jgi:hypothetical protein